MYKKDFPIFSAHNPEQGFIYFDAAATTQRPQLVLDALMRYYTHCNANPHRTLYAVGEQASTEFNAARATIAHFIGAQSEEIIFTAGATASINFIATAWGLSNLAAGDEIVITELEHHANIIPWQQVAQKTGALLKIIPLHSDGTLNIGQINNWITPRTKLVAIAQVSNALGLVTADLEHIIQAAHAVGARVLVDGAQAVGYQPVDVKKLACDFYVFSGHKMLGPTGVGILYVRKELYPELPPYQFGGGAIVDVDHHTTQFAQPPYCYEPGTPAVGPVLGLGAAVNYIESIGVAVIHAHTNALVRQAIEGLVTIPGITLLGSVDMLRRDAHAFSFVVEGMHAHDVGAYLDAQGICVRTGHHCAQLVAKRLGYDASVRLSFHIYNSADEVDYFIACMRKMVAHSVVLKNN